MLICPKCNQKNLDGSEFCSSCGTRLSGAVQNQSSGEKRLHCPNCKSFNISITTESSVSGMVSAHQGAVTTSHVSNSHRNFWICSDCGTKFRNIQNLEEEIAKCRYTHILFFISSGIAAALFVYLFVQTNNSVLGSLLFGAYKFGAAVAAIIFLIYGFYSLSRVKKMKKECIYLKENCF